MIDDVIKIIKSKGKWKRGKKPQANYNQKMLTQLQIQHASAKSDAERKEIMRQMEYYNNVEAKNIKKEETDKIGKAMSLSPMSDINVDISDHAMVEMASKENPYFSIIQEGMAEFELGEVSREIQLTNTHKLTCRQEDNGIYSGEVRCIDVESGEFGQVVHKIIKKTLADLIQELKLKEFITHEDLRNPPSEIHSEFKPSAEITTISSDLELEINQDNSGINDNLVEAAEKIEEVVSAHEMFTEGMPEDSLDEKRLDTEMAVQVKEIIEDANKINEVRHGNEQVDHILSTITSIADVDSRPITININLAKGGRKAEVGEIRVYSGKKVQKQSDGTWKLISDAKKRERTSGPFASARHQDKGIPHTVDMVVQIGGKEVHKRYTGIHGKNKKWVEIDLVDKLEQTLGKQGIEFKIKRMDITKEEAKAEPAEKKKVKKANPLEVMDLIKGGKKAEIGETRKWGKYNFIKQADGWHYVDGPHAGKKMGQTKSPKKTAASSDTKITEEARANMSEKAKEAKARNKAKSAANKKKITAITDEILAEGKDKKKAGDKPKLGTAARTATLDDRVYSKFNEREIRMKGLATGKPSKEAYKSPEGSQVNLVGTVAFGKSNQAIQKDLNKMLFESEVVLDSMGVKMKKPLDFTCQAINKVKNTQATFMPLKDSYDSNDRIDIKDRSTGIGKSIVHEIGHAIDYSMTEEGRTKSLFSEISRSDADSSKDFKRLREILKEAPFYKERTDKSYLADPTEIFARSFEVLAFKKAQELNKQGKISDDYVNAFHPDFLKGSNDRTDPNYPITIDQVADRMAENKQLKSEAKELKDLNAKYQKSLDKTQALRVELNNFFIAHRTSTDPKLVDKGRETKTKFDAAKKEYNSLARKLDNLAKEGRMSLRNAIPHREDADAVMAEVSEIMERVMKQNPIKKAMQMVEIRRIIEENSI